MVKDILNISLLETDIIWENPEKNLSAYEKIILENDFITDIIILPEMFPTGFSMNVEKIFDTPDGKVITWMNKIASLTNTAISGSFTVKENDKFFNRFYFVSPEGETHYYDKRHLYRMGGENEFFQRGEQRLIFTYMGWNICPLICYDLRFPVWSRNNNAYDLLIYVANWPAARNHVWDILLRARAIENQCFVAGVNRTGLDGENIHYSGGSCVVHPKGFHLTGSGTVNKQILNFSLKKEELMNFRKKFPVLQDGDF